MRHLLLAILCVLSLHGPLQSAEPEVGFDVRADRLVIRIGETDVATYVFQDDKVPRSYFAHVKTLAGVQVTRNHPPKKDADAVDHEGLHTGIWLSFGDLNGCDYWRLKARTQHVRFEAEPVGGPGRGTFTVRNRYLTTDGQDTVGEETCRYAVQIVPGGYLIEIDSQFHPGKSELVFGDQEEMGLGLRLATPLAVDRKLGGRILDSAGRRNGKEVWGQTADWCDYSGPLNGQWVGLTVLTGRQNFRPCWSHARDYGFLALNPFGRQAFTKQEPSRVVVKPGESLRLRYGVVVHATQREADYDPSAANVAFNPPSQ